MAGSRDADGSRAADTEVLREEIRRTRAELGETVQALAAKADVKARVRQSAAEVAHRVAGSAAQTADRARQTVRNPRRHPLPWAALAAAAVLVVMMVTRGRRR